MTDTMLDRLNREHAGRWDTWTVYNFNGRTTWHTRPTGDGPAVHDEPAGEHMEAWLAQVTALQDKGVTFQFHRSGTAITATATWTTPDGTPTTHGPAPVPQVITHAETTLKTQATP
jgi:hypothetical protein